MRTTLWPLVATAFLVACGGGGGSSPIVTPTIGPTQTPTTKPSSPPVIYTAELRFVGPLAGQMQSGLRASRMASIDAGTQTPPPIEIESPIAQGCAGGYCMDTGPQGQVQAVVDPQPSSSPATTFALNAPHVTITPLPTPSPGSTPQPQPTGVVAVENVGNDGTDNVQTVGTVTAQIGDPVNLTPATQVYQYLSIAAICEPEPYVAGQYTGWEAWQWNASTSSWQMVNDPSQADIYVTGSQCGSTNNLPAFTVAGDAGTLHIPGGGTFISNFTPFYSVQPSQWADTYTSIPMSTLQQQNPDFSQTDLLIGKTRGGVIFKVWPHEAGGADGYDAAFAGAVEVDGAGVDGF